MFTLKSIGIVGLINRIQ